MYMYIVQSGQRLSLSIIMPIWKCLKRNGKRLVWVNTFKESLRDVSKFSLIDFIAERIIEHTFSAVSVHLWPLNTDIMVLEKQTKKKTTTVSIPRPV